MLKSFIHAYYRLIIRYWYYIIILVMWFFIIYDRKGYWNTIYIRVLGTTHQIKQKKCFKVTLIGNFLINFNGKNSIHFHITFLVKKEFSTKKSKNFSIKFLVEKNQPKVEYYSCIQVYGIVYFLFRLRIRLREAFFYPLWYKSTLPKKLTLVEPYF